MADAGDYYLAATNSLGRSNSPVITVMIIPDTNAPQLLTAVREPDLTNVVVTFSEAVNPAQATNAANYMITNAGGPDVPVESVVLAHGNWKATLQTASEIGAGATLTIQNVTDLAGNDLAPNTALIATPTGFQEGFGGYFGSVDTYLREYDPDTTFDTRGTVLVDAEDPEGDPHHNQGLLRFNNLFGTGPGQIPFGATIHSAHLRLRTENVSPGNIRLHRMLMAWDGSSTWNSLTDGVTPDDTEAVAAADTAIVAPEVEGERREVDVTAAVSSWAGGTLNYGWVLMNDSEDGYQFYSTEATEVTWRPALLVDWSPPTNCLNVAILEEPAAWQEVTEGEAVTFSALAYGTDPVFQWQKKGVNIPGADHRTYVIPATSLTDAGTYRCVVTNACPSTVVSQDAVLRVNPDTVGPALLSALARSHAASPDLDQIELVFDEPLEITGAQTPGNYTVTGPGDGLVPVMGATLADAQTVQLTMGTPLTFGANYSVEVGPGVTDPAAARNPVDPNYTNILQQIVLVDYTDVWAYDENRDAADNYDATVPAWYTDAFDDSAWANGPGLLGLEDDLPVLNLLPAPLNTGLTQTNHTIYFRRTFASPLGPLPAGAALVVNHVIDDGVRCFLNGTEAFRFKMPEGLVSFATEASAGGEAGTEFDQPVPGQRPNEQSAGLRPAYVRHGQFGRDLWLGSAGPIPGAQPGAVAPACNQRSGCWAAHAHLGSGGWRFAGGVQPGGSVDRRDWRHQSHDDQSGRRRQEVLSANSLRTRISIFRRYQRSIAGVTATRQIPRRRKRVR